MSVLSHDVSYLEFLNIYRTQSCVECSRNNYDDELQTNCELTQNSEVEVDVRALSYTRHVSMHKKLHNR